MIKKRYQLYLHPNSVAVIDDIERVSKISRSQLIRNALDHVVGQLGVVLAVQKSQRKEHFYLDDLAGIFKATGKKKTNFSERVDDVIYRREML